MCDDYRYHDACDGIDSCGVCEPIDPCFDRDGKDDLIGWIPIIIIVLLLTGGFGIFGGGSKDSCGGSSEGGFSWILIIVVVILLFNSGDGKKDGFLGGLFG